MEDASKKTITTLENLIDRLDTSSKEEYATLGLELDIPASEFSTYESWSDNKYTRNCIKRTEHYELILLCWEPSQATPVHCHGGEECWVYVIQGGIAEHLYSAQDGVTETSIEQLAPGEKSFMCDQLGYHALDNNTPGRSMTLHLYMDPIDECTIYDKEEECFIPVSLEYDTYVDEPVDSSFV